MILTLFRVGIAATAAFALSVAGTAGVQAAGTASHRTYYVSPAGSDTASGSAGSPYQHIQRCAEMMQAGDTCLIASGIYREVVVPARSGTASAPITYAAAPGADVVVEGTDPVAGWTQTSPADLADLATSDQFLSASPFGDAVRGGHIYQASATLDPALPGNQVFIDRGLSVEAQWPHPGTNPLNPKMAKAQTGTVTSITSNELTQPAGYWLGARFTVRNWFVTETGAVTSYSPGSLEAAALPNCISLNSGEGTPFSLSGKLTELGSPNSWFYAKDAHKLYVWTPDGAPAGQHTIEAKQRNWGIDLSGRSYVTLRGIGVHATSIRTSATSTHNTIDGTVGSYLSAYLDVTKDPNMVEDYDNCGFLTAGETTSGIVLDGQYNTVKNSYLNWSSGNGIALLGAHNSAVNNTIANADYLGTYAAGINLVGSDAVVRHNTVHATGRSSVNIDNKVAGRRVSGSDISYNDLSDYSYLVNDNGAIYICCFVDMAGTDMHHNLLHDPSPFGASFAPGIYADNSTFNVTLHHNVAYGSTTHGVALFNGDGSKGNRAYNNTSGTDPNAVTMFSSTYSDMEVRDNIGDVAPKTGVVESGNVPYATDPLFTDPLHNDYSLKPGSPARNAGAYPYGVKPWTGGSTLTQTLVQAERYTTGTGVARHYAGTGTVLGNFDGGDSAGYRSIDFGAGRNLFVASIGSDPAYAGKSFQIRVDAIDGPVIGTMTMLSTGGFDTYRTHSIPITTTKGVHDVYLVAASEGPGIGNLDWFSFATPSR
ncbi:carbohydrate-binding protein [Kribbella sp. NPDC058245]|uniref:carbohydrate-binding protein n=1 Tax=Kribbella sp. NPDC058245 TaxID=3346399 RepID=UPI0036EF689E